MNMPSMCDQKEVLIGYVYGECAEPEREQFERHLTECADCRGEVEALSATRRAVAAWSTPAHAPGYRLVGVAPRRYGRTASWGLAAAAALVLAAGLSGLRIQHGGNAVTISIGTPAPPASSPNPEPDSGAWRTELAALEARMEARLLASSAATTAPAPAASGPADVMTEVRELIEESERRQQRLLALRITELVGELDLQRRADLTQIQRTMGVLEGRTDAEAARQRELLNYLVRVSQGR